MPTSKTSRHPHFLPTLNISLKVMIFAWLLSSCTYMAAVTQTNIPSARSQTVSATVKKYIVLGFNFDNDDVLELREKLRNQCPGGRVSGILTKDMRTYYLLMFFWARETEATGYCTKDTTAGIEPSAGGVYASTGGAVP